MEADVLPVEAQIRTRTPDCIALVNETVIPLSLKEPVRFWSSFFTWRVLTPSSLDRFRVLMRGVWPSYSETGWTSASNGRRARNLQIPSPGLPKRSVRDRAPPSLTASSRPLQREHV